ncbi:GNAT family N-acetyltransferase [Actinoplanes sp. NPDC049265]|uniref:GNAT family N-acetyltransferase n=1 Tax=Actinoplanes sp. NPDC049265 TaxID=3363902 RepID=UPI0037182502
MYALPPGWSTRRPTLDDVPDLLKLTHASDLEAVGEPDFGTDDVREALTDANTDMTVDCWVALDADGTIVGWAYPHNPTGGSRDFIEVYTWPGRGVPAQRPLLDLILARVRERGEAFGHELYEVRAGAIPSETGYIAALTDFGFEFHAQHARMSMSLAGVPATPPQPPAGVTVRPLDHEDETELQRFHEVIQVAFRDSDHQATSYEVWLDRVLAQTSVTWSEWFVAEVGGQIVGALQSADGDGSAEDEGWVRSLAVLRAYRRRGVGEALLRRAFAAYAEHGRTRAGLGVDMANPTRAARLYRAVGMHPLYEANIYARLA